MDEQVTTEDKLGEIEIALEMQKSLRGILPDQTIDALITELEAQKIRLTAQIESGALAIGTNARSPGVGAV
jgi:hypothetical protein